jgi:hypothetical protein
MLIFLNNIIDGILSRKTARPDRPYKMEHNVTHKFVIYRLVIQAKIQEVMIFNVLVTDFFKF